MDNFKFRFLSSCLNEIFLPSFKIIPCYQGFFSLFFLFDNFNFAIIARMFCGNHLNYIHRTKFPNNRIGHLKLPARWRNVGTEIQKPSIMTSQLKKKKAKLRGGE